MVNQSNQAPMDKLTQLIKLGHKRQQERLPGFFSIADYQDGAYECQWVSPYTKAAGNLNADVMVILQDWSSDEFLARGLKQMLIDYGIDHNLPTSRNLDSLLKKHLGISLAETFGTNLFPFIKPGNMSAQIPIKQLIRAAKCYALPQIIIIQPLLVICLGLSVYNAIARALNAPAAKNLSRAIEQPLHTHSAMTTATLIYAQAHTGALGKMSRNRGGVDRVTKDWAAMAETFWQLKRKPKEYSAN